MLNFTVGPVQESREVLEIGAYPTPYFRNQSFSKIMLENEDMMKKMVFAGEEARTVFLTASGTGAMEAAVINSFTSGDKVLVVSGGSFGRRFAKICEIHGIQYTEVLVPMEKNLTMDMLKPYEDKDYTGLLINMCETSIGKLYNMEIVSEFCKRNNLFLIVDAISAFLADAINFTELGINIMITGSQKALAVPPGISILIMDEEAVRRAYDIDVKSMYFNLADALKNGERGQTPFTPAVGILLQIHKRLEMLCKNGAKAENERIAGLAVYFRQRIKEIPLELPEYSLSNAVTPLMVRENSRTAYDIFMDLERNYNIWVCPNGGELREKLFRVGHLGALGKNDMDMLLKALKELLI